MTNLIKNVRSYFSSYCASESSTAASPLSAFTSRTASSIDPPPQSSSLPARNPLDAAFDHRSFQVGQVVSVGYAWLTMPLGFVCGSLLGSAIALSVPMSFEHEPPSFFEVAWFFAKEGAWYAYEIPGGIAADCLMSQAISQRAEASQFKS